MHPSPKKNDSMPPSEGVLLVNKAIGNSSFHIVYTLRKILGIKKIGHAGTLDPFASGVMVMLIGRSYTQLSDKFLNCDKQYLAKICLGRTTDTFDSEGKETSASPFIPTLDQITNALTHFQGEIEQIPPMFSAKKLKGKKLYELARQGIVVERQPVKVSLQINFISYEYPFLNIEVTCSKGTYIRSLADDIGNYLTCGAYLHSLERTRSGPFKIEDCIDEEDLKLGKEHITVRLLQKDSLSLQD